MKAVFLGAGPAGLAAAHELTQHGVSCAVLDRHERSGGLCRTLDFGGYLFDIGGHRFLSRSVEVQALWKNTLGGELLTKSRRSRIYFRGELYDYPLRPWPTLQKLGPAEALRCLSSYVGAQFSGAADGTTFESWMVRRFGRRLYEHFFRSYTEKVWGIPCARLSSDWAAQRIQQLSLRKAIAGALFPQQKNGIKSLSEKFYYPRLGPGQFCDRLQELCEAKGASFRLSRDVTEIHLRDSRVRAVVSVDAHGRRETHEGNVFLSSIPLSLLIQRLVPAAPQAVLEAARSLTFRAFMSVNLIYRIPSLFEDHWIYLHAPEVHAGRVQNYKNWSRDMVPDPETTSLGVEYFVTEGDALWNLSDEALVKLAVEELHRLGLADQGSFLKGFPVRVAKAYPVYGPGYRAAVQVLREYLAQFENLETMGRAGLFRYNNSDHAILTGLFAARNVMGESHDLWSVDPDRHFAAVLD